MVILIVGLLMGDLGHPIVYSVYNQSCMLSTLFWCHAGIFHTVPRMYSAIDWSY